jgi:hypothetical protein
MLKVTGSGMSTKVEHEGAVLPSSTLVPSKRETIQRLGDLEFLIKNNSHSRLVDNEVITREQCFDTIRKFILSR